MSDTGAPDYGRAMSTRRSPFGAPALVALLALLALAAGPPGRAAAATPVPVAPTQTQLLKDGGFEKTNGGFAVVGPTTNEAFRVVTRGRRACAPP
jgi:hypothetical protein